MDKVIFYFNDTNSPIPNEPIGIGVIILVWKSGKILLEKRTDSDRWAFIGGKVEVSESLFEAALRELKEETGVDTNELRFKGIFSDPSRIIKYPSGKVKRIISITFSCYLKEDTKLICSEESEELKFFTLSELEQLNIAETHIPIRDTLNSGELLVEGKKHSESILSKLFV